jgi:serine/threonine-protein kinase
MGSPLYMSPEQVRASKDIDRRTDIWSLGVILYELVSGRMPFETDAVSELVILIATADPAPLRQHRPDLPAGFEAVVLRCLARERDKRPQNVGELAVALGEYAPKRAMASVDRVLRTMEAAGSALPLPVPSTPRMSEYAETISASSIAAATPSWEKKTTFKKLGPAVVATAAGLGVVAVVAGSVLTLKRRDVTPSPPSALPASEHAASAPVVVEPASSSSAVVLAPAALAASTIAPTPTATDSIRPPRKPGPAGGAGASTPPARIRPTTATSAPPAPSCRIVTEYDGEGQPHFKKVCN